MPKATSSKKLLNGIIISHCRWLPWLIFLDLSHSEPSANIWTDGGASHSMGGGRRGLCRSTVRLGVGGYVCASGSIGSGVGVTVGAT
jgi:hypothetical protein